MLFNEANIMAYFQRVDTSLNQLMFGLIIGVTRLDWFLYVK